MFVLVAAIRHSPRQQYDLLLMSGNQIVSFYQHPQGHLRGFTRHSGGVWTIDSLGNLYQIDLQQTKISLQLIASSPAANDAHDLCVVQGNLATAGTNYDSIVLYDPKEDTWHVKRPWLPINDSQHIDPDSRNIDSYHVNSVAYDESSFLLSLFTARPRPSNMRWGDCDRQHGAIIRWNGDGFGDPIATDIYAPHSLRLSDSKVWWCESFRGLVCRNDGWKKSIQLPGFTRGLEIIDDGLIVGLSKYRESRNPQFDICGYSTIKLSESHSANTFLLPDPYVEVFDVVLLTQNDLYE